MFYVFPSDGSFRLQLCPGSGLAAAGGVCRHVSNATYSRAPPTRLHPAPVSDSLAKRWGDPATWAPVPLMRWGATPSRSPPADLRQRPGVSQAHVPPW